ncbi:hypothetical protein Hte_003757 [Hypoxylon texense]
MDSQPNSTGNSSSTSSPAHFTPSSSSISNSEFGALTTPAGPPLSEILSTGPSTQSRESPRRLRPRFFSSPSQQDSSSGPSATQASRWSRQKSSPPIRFTFRPRTSKDKPSQNKPPKDKQLDDKQLKDKHLEDKYLEDEYLPAAETFSTPSPPFRRRENPACDPTRTSQPPAGFWENLPSRPAPKKINLEAPAAMGASTPASQPATSSETSATPSIFKAGPDLAQWSRNRIEMDYPVKQESPAPSQSTPQLDKGWRPPKCYIDREGDLCLQVGFVSAEFVVDSRLLARASPAWKKLLDKASVKDGKKKAGEGGGEAQDGKPEQQRVVKLPDDNHAAMEIFLNIIHGRFEHVSGYDDFVYCVHLYSLCVLTNKYDMTRILRPWAKGWSKTVHANCDKLGDSLRTKFCHERLWIAWELGDQAMFKKLAETLLLESSSSPGYNLKYVGALEPPEIYGNINGTRLHLIGSLIDSVRTVLEGLIQNSESLGKCPENRAECGPSVLGKAIQSLHRLGLWPLPEPRAVQCSVTALAQDLRLLDFGGSSGRGSSETTTTTTADEAASSPKPPHLCGRRFRDHLSHMVGITLGSVPSVLSKVHYVHLTAQAEKSGFVANLGAKP